MIHRRLRHMLSTLLRYSLPPKALHSDAKFFMKVLPNSRDETFSFSEPKSARKLLEKRFSTFQDRWNFSRNDIPSRGRKARWMADLEVTFRQREGWTKVS